MSMKIPVYKKIARTLISVEGGNDKDSEWLHRIEDWVRLNGPSGSGVDNGTRLAGSTSNRLCLDVSFHHMDEHGCYCGWTNHKIIVRPDLSFGFDIHVTGPDKNQIKSYLGELYTDWLNEEVDL